jgi:hypothetical protein
MVITQDMLGSLVVDATGGTSTWIQVGGDIDGERLMINLAFLYVGGRKSFIIGAPLNSGKDLSQDMLDFLRQRYVVCSVPPLCVCILTCLFLILGAKSQHAAFSLVLSMPLTRILLHASSLNSGRQRQRQEIPFQGVAWAALRFPWSV